MKNQLQPSNSFKSWLSTAALALVLGAAVPVFGSDAKLMQDSVDVQTPGGLGLPDLPIKTLYQAKKNSNQFYYLPSNFRVALSMDQEKQTQIPMLAVYKYNLVYNGGNFKTPAEIDATKPQQGGFIKATFTTGLETGQLKQLRDALIAKKSLGTTDPKISRMPLDEASFTLTVIDPQDPKSMTVIGPIAAPLTDDTISILQPLSQSATDIPYTVLAGETKDGKKLAVPDFPINLVLTFKYSGYGLDAMISVKGEWDNVYKATASKLETRTNYWFASATTSTESQSSSLIQDANIKITIDGIDDPETIKRFEGEFTKKIMDRAFDISGIKAKDSDALDANAAKAGETVAGKIFGVSAGVGIGYGSKAVSRNETGSIDITETLMSRIDMDDVRFSKLDMSNLGKSNLIVVNATDWAVGKVTATLASDVKPFLISKKSDGTVADQQIAMTYGSKVSKETYPRKISPGETFNFGVVPADGDPEVNIKWTIPFAPWQQLKTDLAETTDDLAGSWSQVQSAMEKLYEGTPPSYTLAGDLKLMSGIPLSASALPVSPELYSKKLSVNGYGVNTIEWNAKGGINVVLTIEQQVTGLDSPLSIPLAQFEQTTRSSTNPVKAIILKGKNVLRTRIAGKIVDMNTGATLYEGVMSEDARANVSFNLKDWIK